VRTKDLLLSGLLAGASAMPACLAADAPAAPPAAAAPQPAYDYATSGLIESFLGRGGITWKVLLNESNLGGKELEAVEATFPAGTEVGAHPHRSVEIIYVLSGIYDHEVNGKVYRLTPGMIGIVRPGDKVRHLVPKDGDAKLLILWAPGGEAARIIPNAKGERPAPVPELHR
jgi:quercetin dioxygenase-like cupin family protein